jgi:hypothetical protein
MILASRRAYEGAGQADVLADAIRICQRMQRPLPEWLALAIIGFIWKFARVRKQDLIHFAQADAVEDARSHGLTLERAYEFASQYLEPTMAKGGPEAMKRSYQKVQRRGPKAGVFYLSERLREAAEEPGRAGRPRA